jgi:hypothetical protein
MKLSFLLGGAVGYVLGTRAGHERYEAIVRVARKIGGSQTIQSTAGVLQAQFDTVTQRARHTVAAKMHGDTAVSNGANGNRH